MRAAIRNSVHVLFALAFASACAAHATTHGQARDMRIVSARAGSVNYVFGDVKYRQASKGGEWKTLNDSHNLDSGDVVKTGSTGLVEILLNPGSYLRVGTNSEVELSDASLDALRVKLVRGSAVVEATGYDNYDKLGFMIKIDTPQTEVSIIRSGIYRFNVPPSNVTEVVVQKGRALVGKDEAVALVVKGGSVARVAGRGGTEVAKLDKKNRDELDLWSKERGEELAEANRKLSRRQANTLVASLGHRDPFGDRFNTRYGGVWAYNARSNCYTFVPFYAGWRSPYGGWYDNMLGWWGGTACNSCPGRYSPVVAGGGSNGGGVSGAPGISGSAPSGGRPSGGTSVSPPPMRREMPSRIDSHPARHKEINPIIQP